MQAAKIKFTLVAGLWAFALFVGLPGSAAMAQDAGTQAATAASEPAAKKLVKPYFIEFRSRSALSYGHAFLVHGKLNAQGQVGQVTKEQVEGLHPATESSIPWTIGHVVPVPAEHGFSDGDIEDEYITARYRVLLTEAEYRDVTSFMADLRKRTPVWHAVLYNCASYIGDIAKHMGLKVGSPLQFPDEYITELAALNGGKVVLLQEVMAQKQQRQTTKRASPAAKPAAANPATTPKPAADPSAPSASKPTTKPTAAKPTTPRRTAAAPAAPTTPVDH